MPDAATDVKTDSSTVPVVPVSETPEFKEALAVEREKHRKNLEAEYARKQAELEEQYRGAMNANNQAQQNQGTTGDWFQQYSEKHGITADAARELFTGVVGYVNQQLVAPLNLKASRSELRSQRSELRSSNPKLAKLDDKYKAEVEKIISSLRPEQIGPDTYAATLKYVIGEHVDEIVEESTKESRRASEQEPEIVKPGPTPSGSPAASKPKVTLSSEQSAWAEDRGLSAEDFVEMMKKRAQRLEATGLSKAVVRARLGGLLGSIDF